MGKGLKRSLNRGGATATLKRETYRMNALAVSNIDGASGVGWGTAVLGDLPEGNILIVGAVLACTITEAHAGITATFAGDISVGSAATGDATLSGAEVDIIPSTEVGPATSSVATVRGVSTASIGGTILDNTDGSLELNLNLLIDDAAISADDAAVSVTGTLTLIYSVLGDD